MLYRVQVVMVRRNGLPRDFVTNTWHFDVGGSGTPEDRQVIAAELATFYNAGAGFLAPTLKAGGQDHAFKFYALDDEVPGVDPGPLGPPVETRSWNLATQGSQSLPAEVATCLTIEAGSRLVSEEIDTTPNVEGGTIRPAARRRGRIFYGPLATSALTTEAGSGEVYLIPTARTAILDAAVAMQSALKAGVAPINVVVYSRVDRIGRAVTGFSMNDDFDTMRRRGNKPRTRELRSVQSVALAA